MWAKSRITLVILIGTISSSVLPVAAWAEGQRRLHGTISTNPNSSPERFTTDTPPRDCSEARCLLERRIFGCGPECDPGGRRSDCFITGRSIPNEGRAPSSSPGVPSSECCGRFTKELSLPTFPVLGARIRPLCRSGSGRSRAARVLDFENHRRLRAAAGGTRLRLRLRSRFR